MVNLNNILTIMAHGVIIALTGSVIFLLVTPPQSIILFILFSLLVTTITLSIHERPIIFTFDIKLKNTTLHIFIIFLSIVLLILQITNIHYDIVDSILFIILYIFTPGFTILKLIRFIPSYSPIEYIALAYPISVAYLAITGTIMLILPTNIRGIISLTMIIFLSVTSFFLEQRKERINVFNIQKITLKNKEIILGLTIFFLIYFYFELYPDLANIIDSDISRCFLSALSYTKERPGDFYIIANLYPLFNIYQSFIFYIINPSINTFQIVYVSLNVLALMLFYTLAAQYLKKYGEYTPVVATLIWSTFAGLGWLYFLERKIFEPNTSVLILKSQTNIFSYGDIYMKRNLVYLSMEVSLLIVFALLYILKNNDLSKYKQILLMVILLTPLPLMHPYATYFLFSSLLCLTFLRSLEQPLRNAAYSLIITSFTNLLLNYILTIKIPQATLQFFTNFQYLIAGITLLLISHYGKNIHKFLMVGYRISKAKHVLSSLVVFLLITYFTSLLYIGSNVNNDLINLNPFGCVPSILYPFKLGITGVMTIISIYVIIMSRKKYSNELVAMCALIILMILFSKIISALQMQYTFEFTFNTKSWLSENIRNHIRRFDEKRMFELYKIPMSIIASITLSHKVITNISKRKSKLKNSVIITGLISLIIISGMSSTFLGFEYYNELPSVRSVSSLELDIINTLRDQICLKGKSTIISPHTDPSFLTYTSATTIVRARNVIRMAYSVTWNSESPEFSFFTTRYSKIAPIHIYLHKKRDVSGLSKYSGKYLTHISDIAPISLENSEVQVKSIYNWSTPTQQSTTALIVPYNNEMMTLSQPYHTEHTVLSLYFEESMKSMNIYKPSIIYNNIEIDGMAIFNGDDSYIRTENSTINFDRILVEFEFQPLDVDKIQMIVCKSDWGPPARKSWEITQYGNKIVFKVSADGKKEVRLSTEEILEIGKLYAIKCVYDGDYLQILVNNEVAALEQYQNGIYKSNVDLVVGALLRNNRPTAAAKMNLRYLRILEEARSVEPIYHAYDFLSATGLNYTTVLTEDSSINDYETVILPYDDILTAGILTKISEETPENRCIIILNANGYGPLLNLFGNLASNKLRANEIIINDNYPLEAPLNVSMVRANNNTEILALYSEKGVTSPLIMKTSQKGIELVYIDIFPLKESGQLFNSELCRSLMEVLDNDNITFYDESYISPWFTEPVLLFTELNASGTIRVFSNSFASVTLPNSNKMNTDSHNSIQINCTKITIKKGYGFYTTLIAEDPSIILYDNQKEGQKSAIKIEGEVTFLLRQPEIDVNGQITFETFYMLHPQTIITDGRKTTLGGDMTLKIYVSDQNTIALPYKLNSPIKVRYKEPLI